MLVLICDFWWCGKEFYPTSDIILSGDVYSNSHFAGAGFALLIYFEQCIACLVSLDFHSKPLGSFWASSGTCVCLYVLYVCIYLYFYHKFTIWMSLGLVTVEITYCKSCRPVLALTWNPFLKTITIIRTLSVNCTHNHISVQISHLLLPRVWIKTIAFVHRNIIIPI